MRGPTSNLGSDRFDLISDSNASSMFAGNLPAFSVDWLLSVGISEYEIMIEVCFSVVTLGQAAVPGEVLLTDRVI